MWYNHTEHIKKSVFYNIQKNSHHSRHFLRGSVLPDCCAAIAGNYTMECILCTAALDNHWYGAAFEPVLGKLIDMLK